MKSNMQLNDLSIIIPTFNRYDRLIKILDYLNKSPGIEEVNRIVVLDNATPGKNFLDIPVDIRNRKNLEYIKNQNNLGLSGNLIKCFESCQTKWMWILGDDDVPNLKTLKNLKDYNYDYINFSSHIFQRQRNLKGKGLSSFVSNLDNYSNCLFISASIYKVSKFRKHLQYGINNAKSLAPHIPILLRGMKDGSTYAFLSEKLIDEDKNSIPSWHITEQSLSFASIPTLDFIISSGLSKELFKKMTINEIHPIYLYISVLKYSEEKKIKQTDIGSIFKKCISERYLYSSRKIKIIANSIHLFQSLFPKVLWIIFQKINKMGVLDNIRS